MKPKTSLRNLILAAATLGLACSAHAATIFFDDFTTGSNGALNGQAPVTRPGTETWIAGSVFTKNTTNGVVNSSGTAAAYLPITTIDTNEIYMITARVSNTTTGSNWVGVGWTTQDSSTSAWNSAGTGRFWMLWRGNNELRTFTSGAGGTTNSTGTTAAGVDNVLDMRIIMDGPEETVSYYYKNPNATEWTFLFDQSLGGTSNIESVGFTTNTSGTSIISYEYTLIPEPTTALLGGLGMLFLLRRRR